MSEVVGLDFAWAKPNPQACWNAGYRFALGYISHDTAKCLTNPNDYRHAGLGVHFVFEDLANQALRGAAQGKADGEFAEAFLNNLGENLTSPVFFAIDFDTNPGQYGALGAYLDAANLATRRPIGVYGEFDLIEHFVTPGVQPVQYGWQTAAWSSGRLSQKASFYQRATHHYPAPAGTSYSSFDEDVLIHDLP